MSEHTYYDSEGVVGDRIAELEALVAELEKERDQARIGMALFWNRTGPHPKSRWIPAPILESWIRHAKDLLDDRDRLDKLERWLKYPDEATHFALDLNAHLLDVSWHGYPGDGEEIKIADLRSAIDAIPEETDK